MRREADELLEYRQTPKVSMKHLRLPVIDKLSAEGLPQPPLPRRYHDLFVARRKRRINREFTSDQVQNPWKENLLHRIDNGPSIYTCIVNIYYFTIYGNLCSSFLRSVCIGSLCVDREINNVIIQSKRMYKILIMCIT